MTEKACRDCNFITEEDKCPNCGGTSLSDDWTGYVVIREIENSEIAKRLDITKPGRFALKVR